jgi:hypothetical protein
MFESIAIALGIVTIIRILIPKKTTIANTIESYKRRFEPSEYGKEAFNYKTYKKRDVLTEVEQIMYWRIIEALPEYVVFGQTAFSGFMEPDVDSWRETKRFYSLFGRIAQKRADFVVMDKKFRVIGIIELDDRSHDIDKDMDRDELVGCAGINTIRWHVRDMPEPKEIRERFLSRCQQNDNIQGVFSGL